jgi:hypothetical protein
MSPWKTKKGKPSDFLEKPPPGSRWVTNSSLEEVRKMQRACPHLVISYPQPTKVFTSEQIFDMGLFGIYNPVPQDELPTPIIVHPNPQPQSD